MMVAEIAGGVVFGSMALLADGWHMSTHAAALAIAGLAYQYARHHKHDRRFAFGTGKLGDLAAFASAIALGMIALLIAYESLIRLARPVPIAYTQAISIAVVGLAVNLICAWLLREEHPHQHDHGEGGAHDHLTTGTTISGRPICTSLQTRSPRSWPSAASCSRFGSVGHGSMPSWASSAPA
jgi:cation diffusion facilitator family transporter